MNKLIQRMRKHPTGPYNVTETLSSIVNEMQKEQELISIQQSSMPAVIKINDKGSSNLENYSNEEEPHTLNLLSKGHHILSSMDNRLKDDKKNISTYKSELQKVRPLIQPLVVDLNEQNDP